MCTGSGGDTLSALKPLMAMILSICIDYLQVRNARKTTFVVRQAVREEHSRPLNLRWLWPCPSVWTTCSMNFKSSAKCFTAILVREVFPEIFLLQRASGPRSGDIAGNDLRSAEERKGFFLSPHSFGTAICSFPGISASNTNFYLVNQLVRYVPIFIVDTNVQQQPICLL